MKPRPAKGSHCARGGKASIARAKIEKALGKKLPKGTTLKKTKIGKFIAWCTSVTTKPFKRGKKKKKR